ncbi:hypothetical protein [Priestia megaterium]|uniref:hypothetical protein n=1 Tax=Priestia megaterium TaxID=1404 RepID=UPI000BF91507|nr:hypothetical protein [Priestia megaterium]PFR91298.1 hypothetical protein COK39_22730 [Priestia megaterium]
MVSLYESKFLLENSNELLGTIEDFYQKSVDQKEASIVLLVKIKHFLENINSALDYAAFVVFNNYCVPYVTSNIEDHERQVYFPSKHSSKKFNQYIKNVFPELENQNSEIVDIFKAQQPFINDSSWFTDLKKLANTNKHKFLTKQVREQHTHIDSLRLAGGGGISGVTLITEGETTPIVVNNTPLDFSGKKRNPLVTHLDAEVEVDFLFKDLRKSVVSTLSTIQKEATLVINDIDKLL